MYKKSKGERYVKGSSHVKPVNINFGDIFLHLGSKSGDREGFFLRPLFYSDVLRQF